MDLAKFHLCVDHYGMGNDIPYLAVSITCFQDTHVIVSFNLPLVHNFKILNDNFCVNCEFVVQCYNVVNSSMYGSLQIIPLSDSLC